MPVHENNEISRHFLLPGAIAMSFSKRQGIEAAKALQIESMDWDLRNSLWNVFHLFVVNTILARRRFHPGLHESEFSDLFHHLWIHFFKWPLNTLPDETVAALEIVHNWYFDDKTPWNRIYDFVEFVPGSLKNAERFTEFCDDMMKREASAYRFVGGIIGPLTNATEIEAIESVASEPGVLALVGTHIKDAVGFLANRTNPNYRNSMKESISAVESVVKIITGQNKGTLGQMLEKIGPQLNLHPSLVSGYKSLYGYTSDADGIRHGMKDDRVPDLEDARYFLVACSAFANYLIEKARKLNVLPAST
jgi:AbiJ N-terminal domain 4